MKTRLFIIVSAGAFGLAPAIAAQEAGRVPVFAYANQPSLASAPSQPSLAPHNVLEMMSDKLDLSGQQKLQLQTLIERRQQLLAALHQHTELSDDQKTAQFQRIRQQTKEQFAAMLTPEQKRDFEKMMRP